MQSAELALREPFNPPLSDFRRPCYLSGGAHRPIADARDRGLERQKDQWPLQGRDLSPLFRHPHRDYKPPDGLVLDPIVGV